MYAETYGGFRIRAALERGAIRLTITDPNGASDSVLLPGSLEEVLRRARRSINALRDNRAGFCRCGSPALATDADGDLCCLACAARRLTNPC